MSQTIVQQHESAELRGGTLTWASPDASLWVASRQSNGSIDYLGFIERTMSGFVAVDGAGASLGRFPTLEHAKASFGRSELPAPLHVIDDEPIASRRARFAPSTPARASTPWASEHARVVSAAALWRA